MREKRQVTLPQEVVEAAGIKIDDQVDWRFEGGEIRGRKLTPQPEPKKIVGKLARRGDACFLQIPKGYKLAPDAIEQAVAEDTTTGTRW
jgi:bifunctional DNA-binding transcriptional regulator/antitoxin component of YhaV-PrlF toxin-antitoxin module